ncbi:MAG: phage head-tail connector protein [Ignavibacteria bacterium]|nr:phage head-tail connector protein [Ignavibacteria bacterium]
MINIDDLKYFLRIKDTSQDNFLRKIIDMTTARINNLCKRKLSYSRIYEILSGKNENIIRLSNYPVEKVDSVMVREETGTFSADLFGGKPVEENLFCEQDSGKIILLNGFTLPAGNSNIRIKYFAGYIENANDPINELPPDLKWVALMMSAESFLKSFQYCGDENLTRRIGLERMDILKKDSGSETKYSFTYKDENYDSILEKYLSVKI